MSRIFQKSTPRPDLRKLAGASDVILLGFSSKLSWHFVQQIWVTLINSFKKRCEISLPSIYFICKLVESLKVLVNYFKLGTFDAFPKLTLSGQYIMLFLFVIYHQGPS